ncbi:hypothetical protein O6H91_03G005400 [Diphasiastrum complanatum]|uniref:Uncharacterized protein n=2 Tax=Diphasiastrum complanatum TaxID=34168 RepID=A0ACC2E385_DIPCM|nr:hypothetical protein O6H91_Y304400 [Diphasiastrum complanatum]KAJ7289931.1 hypothetical protein O6H91_Y304400 [Diphasiastrum complanatum]KAJ7289932.1 hypothetical protein O6H91_Y304400 [Diphasiastrum complanatum]KAJ7560901.1 hypothetical protein O6H91_03G005400 [Diphasiastrum complanatum]KAJ7560902.1 hypothetical protein O6H91_03G005400 [Diphasiastrum complanatum]
MSWPSIRRRAVARTHMCSLAAYLVLFLPFWPGILEPHAAFSASAMVSEVEIGDIIKATRTILLGVNDSIPPEVVIGHDFPGLPPDIGNISGLPPVPERALMKLNDVADQITNEVASKYDFCIRNGEKERSLTFGVPLDSPYLRQCFYEGSLLLRLCTVGEIQIYVKSIRNVNDPPPIPNCNQTHWSKGCDAGWASVVLDVPQANPQPSRNFSTFIPKRATIGQPCCEGFFCPQGLSCMMPCPLGAFCPRAQLNQSTGQCEPYAYQLRPDSDAICGGANAWADINSTPDIFCQAGNYCHVPSITQSCKSGYFCRQGSTSEEKCYRFTACKPGSARQNLLLYGGFFIVVLAILLLVIYGCSDQIMSVREKRKIKARERAAQLAREQAFALARWKLAREKAKQHVRSISDSLRRTFSRKRPKSDEEIENLTSYGEPKSDETTMPETIAEDRVRISPTPFRIRKSHSVIDEDLYSQQFVPPMIHAVEEDVETPAPRHIKNTRSQMFKYAYGQIEKEKVVQSFELDQKGAMDVDGPTRPPIDLTFKNLTMFLKKSKKKILTNVTGRLSPGNITAIMGPSGAGKTTFLNAVAGKSTQSYTTGHIYINDKEGYIQSYRKIIGFVPQDDIVHGSLTVEENLWFSANYRLPHNMPKYEQVLVVERIISSLGLGPIRDALVGTVEKRGISGGQRKRVNVGLEMVMVPSLLILDEPTSGLDSTSSRLVLQALRREASAGVNVIVVLHQPSYALFQMFDHVMFLAKGGQTAYLGPINELEQYFANLGYIVPDRVNPPDYFMDVLEGVARATGDSSRNHTDLPLLWIQHNGYEIPQDLQATTSESSSQLGDLSSQKKAFMHKAWEEFKLQIMLKWEAYQYTFFTVRDLSGRQTPGFFKQFRVIMRRVATQKFREARLLAQDYIILLLAGICLGLLSNVKDVTLGSSGYPYTIIALSLLCMIAALRTFSLDRLQFWRESASGINRVAFFLAKDTADHFSTVIKPLVYLSMFYFFNDPRSTLASNFEVTWALVYCVTGVAYIFAIVLQPSTAQLCSVFFPIVLTLIATKKGTAGFLKILVDASYARWALEAYVVANAERYDGVWLITRCGLLLQSGYRLDRFNFCVGVLVVYGGAARLVAMLCLILCHRQRQK